MSRVLVIDDNETLASGVVLLLAKMGHEGVAAGSGPEGLECLRQAAFDLVITDYLMDGMDGLAVLKAVKAEYPQTDVLLLTGHGSIDLAVAAMREGALDFVEKVDLSTVLPAKIDKALQVRQLRRDHERLGDENLYLRGEIDTHFNHGEIVGASPVVRQVLNLIDKVSATDSSVLVYGESGTGKELVARAIHNQSPRHDRPFVKVNCGALPRDLVESELFGHERGAFTGAVRQKKGKFELAESGTIFLDEVGDLPLEAQVKILMVLQEKQFDRVGGERTLDADVRVIAATNRNLPEMVSQSTFREDLYYRLAVIPIHLPPLRERRQDIPLLVEHFVQKKCREMNLPVRRLTAEAMAAVEAYPWPGNVRELENVVERALVLADGPVIGPHDLPLGAEGRPRSSAVTERAAELGRSLDEQLDELERRLIVAAMEQAGQVKTRAAEILGIKTSALYYKLDKHGLDRLDKSPTNPPRTGVK